MRKNTREMVDLLGNKKGSPQEMFGYNSYTMKTRVTVPDKCPLIIREDLSNQLSIEGRIYMGPRTKGTQTTNVNNRNHTVYIYSDLI